MDLPLFLLTGVSLSMDAFALAVGLGAARNCRGRKQKLRLAMTFGAFQAIMPLLGHVLGVHLAIVVSPYDRLIACTLLAALGVKMSYDAWRHPYSDDEPSKRLGWVLLLAMGLTTSIDALCVGLGYSLVGHRTELAAPVIGCVTFLFSYAGVEIGERLGVLMARYSGYLGGAILIAIGIKTLVT